MCVSHATGRGQRGDRLQAASQLCGQCGKMESQSERFKMSPLTLIGKQYLTKIIITMVVTLCWLFHQIDKDPAKHFTKFYRFNSNII